MAARNWLVGMHKLGGGIYASADGGMLTCDAYEACIALGASPTKENQAIIEQVWRAMCAKHFPGVEMERIVRDADPR